MNDVSLQRLLDLSVLSESDPTDLKSIYRAAIEELRMKEIEAKKGEVGQVVSGESLTV